MAKWSSFRDPEGRLFVTGDHVYRLVRDEAVSPFEAFLASDFAKKAQNDGLLVRTNRVDNSSQLVAELGEDSSAFPIAYEHDKVWFPTYPYEWPAQMLYAAGDLTLRLARDAIGAGFGLKDATPYNVLFQGPKPVFIDLLSFDSRDPLDPIWLPYAQFERNFVLPLLVRRLLGISPHEFALQHRDGLEPEFAYRMLSGLQRFGPGAFGSVTLPTWLSKKGQASSTANPKRLNNPEAAKFVLMSVLGSLQKKLRRQSPATASSKWTAYMQTFTYDDASFKQKQEFVSQAISEIGAKQVLDVGCNTGHFSFLASDLGANVVAADYDPEVVGFVYERATKEDRAVLPIVADLTRPTPSTGWRNAEWPSFLDRAAKSFDCVMMLAVIHHMHVTERVPMEEILGLAADLTRDALIVEFVGTNDPMFRQLARTKESLFAGLTKEVFEAQLSCRFKIIRSITLNEGNRELYLVRLK